MLSICDKRLFQNCFAEARLAAEVILYDAFADLDCVGDLLDGGFFKAGRQEYLPRRVDDLPSARILNECRAGG